MKQVIRNLIVASSALAGMLAGGAAFAQQQPDYVRIRSIDYAGTGCKAGTVASDVALDLTAFTLLFDSYVAEAGPGIPWSEGRKNCKILVNLEIPNGWSYTVVDVEYRGYVALDQGVSFTQASDYYFRGQSGTGKLQTTMYGELSDDYHIQDRLGLDAVVWSPCGATAPLIIQSQIRVMARSRNGRGLATIDSIDGILRHEYGIKFRRCRA